MTLENFIEEYEAFFSQEHHLGSDDSFEDTIKMHTMEAVGKVDFLTSNDGLFSSLKPIYNMDTSDIQKISQRMLSESKIKNAFFYYALADHKKGFDVAQSAKKAQRKWSISGEYSIAKVHSVRKGKKTAIFLDWDETSEINNNLRRGLVDFVKYFSSKITNRPYSVIISSATYDLAQRLKKYDAAKKRFSELFDAAYCVPAIANTMRYVNGKDRTLRMGKLYTDICKKLDFDPSYSVIVTDILFDRSADDNFPITTLITNGHDATKTWEHCIDHLEELGKGSIKRGASNMTKFPIAIHDEDVHEFKLAKGLSLYSHPRFKNAYFMNSVPTLNKIAPFLSKKD